MPRLLLVLAAAGIVSLASEQPASAQAVRGNGCIVGQPCALGVPLPPPTNRGTYAVDGDGCVIGNPCPYRRADRLLVVDQVPADPRIGTSTQTIAYTVGRQVRETLTGGFAGPGSIRSLPPIAQPAWGAPLWTTVNVGETLATSDLRPVPALVQGVDAAPRVSPAAAADPHDLSMAIVLRGMQPGVLAAAAQEAARRRAADR